MLETEVVQLSLIKIIRSNISVVLQVLFCPFSKSSFVLQKDSLEIGNNAHILDIQKYKFVGLETGRVQEVSTVLWDPCLTFFSWVHRGSLPPESGKGYLTFNVLSPARPKQETTVFL